MKSAKSSRLLNLRRDLPTGAADILALRRARRHEIRDLKTYLEFLANFVAATPAALRARKGPSGLKPFEL
jgi:hypothetical protein